MRGKYSEERYLKPTCVSAPCLSRDRPCRPKTESSHPRLGTESGETRLAHPARHHKEWSVSTQTQVPPTLQQGSVGDAMCHPRGPVEGCMDCGSVEAGVGSIRSHPSTSPRVGPRRRLQGRRPESKTLDDCKQTANWGRSVGLQIIREEVRTGGQCSMWVWRARTDGW